MCIRSLKAKIMPDSVHYFHRLENGADELTIPFKEV